MTREGQERNRLPREAEAAFAEFLRRREKDPSLDFEAYCSEVPELAGALRILLSMNRARTECGGSPEKQSSPRLPPPPPGPGRPPEALAQETGGRLGRYRLLREIGRGGMGVVYLAEDDRLLRPVALKILKERCSTEPAWVERFEREAKIAAQLSHPNIATIYDLGQVRDVAFIAMEFVEGQTLQQMLAGGRPIPFEPLLAMAIQILEGLCEAHERGVVHRDLKPLNIMVTRGGRVKILDFGLAKALFGSGVVRGERLESLHLTKAGELLGTVPYMSPEQARGLTVDARSDLFSLGTILYEMCTGSSPFLRTTVADTLTAVLTETPRPVSALNRECSPAIEPIVEKLLAKELEHRYPSSAQVLADFLRVKQGLDSGAGLRPRAERPRPKSIAVLPFVNMSPEPENEYFTDGLTEELINSLAQITELQVAARASAFAFKGKHLDVRTVGRELNVATVLEGSVRKAGDRLRVTAQLINVADGYHLWSQRFDRKLEDVFEVQDEIARTIVGTLKPKVVGESGAPLIKRTTENLEAYELYLKGRFFWNKRFEGLLQRSIECFLQAIQLDPDYALAYSGLADSYIILGVYGYFPVAEALSRAQAAATRALEIDADLCEAHISSGMAKLGVHPDYTGAARDFQRALELRPNDPWAHSWLGLASALMGREDEAIAAAKRSLELDPLSPAVHGIAGLTLYWSRRFDDALAQCGRASELEPEHLTLLWVRGTIHMATGNYAAASPLFQRLVELTNRACFYLSALGAALGKTGRTAEAREIAAQLERRREKEHVSPLYLAWVYLGLGDTARAGELYDLAREEGCFFFWLPSDPIFEDMRADPRFRAYYEQMAIPLEASGR